MPVCRSLRRGVTACLSPPNDRERLTGVFITLLILGFVLPGLIIPLPRLNDRATAIGLTVLIVIAATFAIAALLITRYVDPGVYAKHSQALTPEIQAILSNPEYKTSPIIRRIDVLPATAAAASSYSTDDTQSPSTDSLQQLVTPRMQQWSSTAGATASLDTNTRTDPKQQESYCRVCHIWRPNGTAHCYTCDWCVDGFDHHCGVIGACIGRYNHRFFLLFLLACGTGGSGLAAADVLWITQLNFSGNNTWNTWHPFVAIALTILHMEAAALFIFAALHCILITGNSTSKLKFGRTKQPLEWDWQKTYNRTLCAPVRWRHLPETVFVTHNGNIINSDTADQQHKQHRSPEGHSIHHASTDSDYMDDIELQPTSARSTDSTDGMSANSLNNRVGYHHIRHPQRDIENQSADLQMVSGVVH